MMLRALKGYNELAPARKKKKNLGGVKTISDYFYTTGYCVICTLFCFIENLDRGSRLKGALAAGRKPGECTGTYLWGMSSSALWFPYKMDRLPSPHA